MSKDKKTGRPNSKNVDYFPHKCKDDKELRFIQHKYKSEGYEVFYRLQQCLGDADFIRIDLSNNLEKQMFEMSMNVEKEIVYGVIDILLEMNWLDKELYQEEKEDSLLSVNEYEELFPHKNVNKSFKKFLDYEKSHTHSKAMGWLENEKSLKPLEFKKSVDGKNIAYCEECGKQEFSDYFQLKQGSSCCKVKYTNVRPSEARVSKESDSPF